MTKSWLLSFLCFCLLYNYLASTYVLDILIIIHWENYFQITWQWLSFTNSARKDSLQLYHWVSVFYTLEILSLVHVCLLVVCGVQEIFVAH